MPPWDVLWDGNRLLELSGCVSPAMGYQMSVSSGQTRRVFYVHALGGHGLAIGTMLGEAVAQKAWGVVSGDPVQDAIFDDFAFVRHGWLPPWQPFRRLTASIGLSLERL
jgi:hypothetical protein